MNIAPWIKRTAKQLIRSKVSPWLLDKDLLPTRTVSPQALKAFMDSVCPVATNHGLVRVGGEGDGGYLVPDDLDGVRFCFSPGVSEVADFELSLAARGIKCFLADYSVDAPPVQHPLFVFEKKYLGPSDDAIFITLESWLSQVDPAESDLILQMDIEGAEYGVILDASDETLSRFRIVVIEFHDLQGLTDRLGFELINLTLRKLLKQFDIVHIHPNNCRKPLVFQDFEIPPVMEFSFLRKDRITTRLPASSFPHPLDRTNMSGAEDFALPSCWFRTPGASRAAQ